MLHAVPPVAKAATTPRRSVGLQTRDSALDRALTQLDGRLGLWRERSRESAATGPSAAPPGSRWLIEIPDVGALVFDSGTRF